MTHHTTGEDRSVSGEREIIFATIEKHLPSGMTQAVVKMLTDRIMDALRTAALATLPADVHWAEHAAQQCEKWAAQLEDAAVSFGSVALSDAVNELAKRFRSIATNFRDLATPPAQVSNPFRDALHDAWVCCDGGAEWHEDDPRKTLNSIICWHCDVALDPLVSEKAAQIRKNALEEAAGIFVRFAETNRQFSQNSCLTEHFRHQFAQAGAHDDDRAAMIRALIPNERKDG